MRIASLAHVKARFSEYVNASAGEPVVVTRRGRPAAVLLAVADEDELEDLLLAHSRKLRRILDRSRRQIRAGRGIPHDRFWAEVASDAARGKRG